MSMGQMPGGGMAQALPPPQTPKEQDSMALVFGQALQGLGRELVAQAMGQQADPVIMSKFHKIILQVQDAMARASSQGATNRSPQASGAQTGISGQGNPVLSTIRDYNSRG